MTAGRLRIDDLRRPVLTDLQRAALDHVARRPVTLSADAVLAEAERRTGLDDFGPDDFVERLERWVDEVDADGERTELGRLSIFTMCVRYAVARLRLHRYRTDHPKVEAIELPRPLIVVGLPRSGTTHLLNLLSADTSFRSLPLWESYEPVPVPGEEPDGRFARADAEWQGTLAVLPHMAAMHPMSPAHIHEEIELMGPDFSGYTLEWVARVPGWRDYYLAHDQTPHYRYMRTALQVLTHQRGPARWVLKSPQHLEQLGPLLATFPDATVVMTHRDPVSVVQSAATMMAYAARIGYTRVDADGIIDYWTDRVGRLLDALGRDVHLVGEGRRIDVHFDRFMADDRGTLDRIYRAAGLTLEGDAARAVDAYRAAHPRGKEGLVAYDLWTDFGRRREELSERFAPYRQAFGVAEETA